MSTTGNSPRSAAVRPSRQGPPKLGAIGGLILVTSLIPYLCGYLLSPSGFSFQGALNNIGDLSQYLAAIRQGSEGAWRYTNQFTPDHARRLVMYTPYMLAGHLSLGFSPGVVFQLLRLGCGALALWAMALFCRLFLGDHTLRAGWLFVLLAGGLYWLSLPLAAFFPGGVSPAALTAPELNPLITLVVSPHEALGLAAELLGFACILRASGAGPPLWTDERLRPGAGGRNAWTAGATVSFLALALSYPFLLPTVGLVLLTYAAVAARGAWNSRMPTATKKRRLRAGDVFASELRTITISLVPAGVVGLYYALIFHGDRYWSHSGLTQVSRPDLAVMCFAFAPLAVGAYVGARTLREARAAGANSVPAAWTWFPLIWAIVNACTLILPIWQQGRQTLGLSIPLALMSFYALAGPRAVAGRQHPRLRPLPASILVFSAPLLVALYTAVAASGVNHDYYTPTSVVLAAQWLGSHAGPNDVVLSSAGFGNLAPEYCTCRVMVGQNFQSFDRARRLGETREFYAAAGGKQARKILSAMAVHGDQVAFIVFSPFERDLGHLAAVPLPGFSVRYKHDSVTILGRAPAHG
ncbi:MAG TPA: hypothetical protein VNL71_20245 [Chloroflexota bacterium]|nr:hypothetical protein [Chloroflexota bacterium]